MASAQDDVVLPVVEERVRTGTRRVSTGVVRVTTRTVAEARELALPPCTSEEVAVERVPIGRVVDAPVPPHVDGDLTVIPVYEEVLVRQWILKEEVRVRRTRRTVTPPPQTVPLRRTEVAVRRVEPRLPDAPPDNDNKPHAGDATTPRPSSSACTSAPFARSKT